MSQAQQATCLGDALRKHVSPLGTYGIIAGMLQVFIRPALAIYLGPCIRSIARSGKRLEKQSDSKKKELPTLPHSSTGANLLFFSPDKPPFSPRHFSHRQPSSCRFAKLHRRASFLSTLPPTTLTSKNNSQNGGTGNQERYPFSPEAWQWRC